MKQFLRTLWIAILLCATPWCATRAENMQVADIGLLSSFELSPDGRTAVGIVNGSLSKDGPAGKSKLLIWNIDCLLEGGDSCLIKQELPWLRSSFLYWISGTNQFVVNSLKTIQIDSAPPFTRRDLSSLTVAVRPKVMDRDAPELPPLEGWRVLQSEDRYLSPDGRVALSLVERDGDQRLVWPEGQMVIPRHLYDSGSIMPLRYSIIASEGGFYFWSSSLGTRGELTKYTAHNRQKIPLPDDLHGSLQIIFPPRAAVAVGVFTADGVRGLEYSGPFVALIDKHVQAVRQAKPDLELKGVNVSDDLKFWALLFRGFDDAQVLRVVEPTSGRVGEVQLSPATPAMTGNQRKITSTFVEIWRGIDIVPARLYAQNSLNTPQKLVIRFHGGPQITAATDGSDWIQRLTEMGFDVLDVDYRGSAGYGAKHLLDLKRPIARVLDQDLTAVVDWAKTQQYSKVGFVGTSAGGLAGASALSARSQGLDFIVLESPLIDWPSSATVKNCRRAEGQTVDRLFGLKKLADNICSAHPTGLLERTRFAKTPVFLIAGKRDQRTPFEIADRWMSKARAAGACIVLAKSEKGGHTLLTWPSRDQEIAGDALKTWIAAVEVSRDCPSDVTPRS